MKLLLFIVGVAVALPADQRNPPTRSIRLAVTAFSSSPSSIAPAPTSLAPLRVEQVWFSFKDLRLREAGSCKESGAVQLQGPVTVELVTGHVIGAPESINLSVAKFCGLELRLRRSRGKADGAPTELRGNAILIQARREDGTRVIVTSQYDRRIWLAARREGGFDIPADNARLFIAVDVARWLGGLDLSTADIVHQGGSAAIWIDEKRNPDLLASFNQTIAAGFGLFHDVDSDGVLHDGEREGPGWLAAGEQSSAAM